MIGQINFQIKYGKIKFENDQLISFNEKSSDSNGWINNGFYIIRRYILDGFEANFSLEYDVFPKLINENKMGVFRTDNDHFIDIGIPEDYLMLNIHVYYDGLQYKCDDRRYF